jgi:hypothetical protein
MAVLAAGARDEGPGAAALGRRARAGVTRGCTTAVLAAGIARARGGAQGRRGDDAWQQGEVRGRRDSRGG